MPGFTKLFSTITASTVWMESDQTRIVWITMLAMADQWGRVMASLPGLAHVARVPLESTEAAVKSFLGPDAYSRSKEFEGRRIAEIDGGWQLLNYGKYRSARAEDERREYLRQKQAEHRRKHSDSVNANVNKRKQCQPASTECQPPSTQAEAEAEEKQKPSRGRTASDGMKHSTDPRHIACKNLVFGYYKSRNQGCEPPWDGQEGKALARILSASPHLTPERFRALLANRYKSEVTHGDRPSKWIGAIHSYSNGPLDKYGKPLHGGANGKAHYPTKDEITLQNARELIAELQDTGPGLPFGGEAGECVEGDPATFRKGTTGIRE